MLEKAATQFERADIPDGIAWSHHDLGWAAVAEQDLTTARLYFARIMPMAERGALHEWIDPRAI